MYLTMEWLDKFMFTASLIKKCFPHKEAILFNLDVAVSLANDQGVLEDDDRITLLCQCSRLLQVDNVAGAVKAAELAGYNLMAAAIAYHFEPNDKG